MTCRPECKSQFTVLKYWASLDLHKRPHPEGLVGIIADMGPSTHKREILKHMVEAGVSILRVAGAQNVETFSEAMNMVNEVCEEIQIETGITRTVGLALDVTGREIRIGELKEGKLIVHYGDLININLSGKAKLATTGTLYVNYPKIIDYLEVDSRIFINQGTITLKVRAVDEKMVKTMAENGGVIRSYDSIQIPGADFDDRPVLSGRDLVTIRHAISNNFSILFVSQIVDSTDLAKIRELLGSDVSRILLIPKIQSRQALRDIDDIIRQADAIYVSRGDLGVQAPHQKIFLLQKVILSKCILAGKPVIISNGFLESMAEHPRPTRAELLDLANAVFDGVGAVALTDTVAWGKYPVVTCAVASHVCREAEAAMHNKLLIRDLVDMAVGEFGINRALSAAVVRTAYLLCARAIVVLTTTGRSANDISKFFPCCPILAVTRNSFMARRISIVRSVIPIHYSEELLPDWREDIQIRFDYAMKYGLCENIFRKGHYVIFVYGWRPGPGYTNTMRIHLVGDVEQGRTI